MVKIFNNEDIIDAYSYGTQVKEIWSEGVKVWPTTYDTEWIPKRFYGVAPGDGSVIWHDEFGNSYYHTSSGTYKLNNKTWEECSAWLPVFSGPDYIWNDINGHAYYSRFDDQYELINGIWIQKSWNINIDNGNEVWKSGSHIYYSNGSVQYELVNGRWITKSWNISINNGNDVWHDGSGNTYYKGDYQLVNGTWVTKTWINPPSTFFYDGGLTWIDKEGHTFYSYQNEQYMIVGDTFIQKNWTGIPDEEPRYGWDIWHDGSGNTYYTRIGYNYQLIQVFPINN